MKALATDGPSFDFASGNAATGKPLAQWFEELEAQAGTRNHTRTQERRDADMLRAAWSRAFDALKSHLEPSGS